MDTFRNSPPVSRTFAALIFVFSMINRLQPAVGYRLMFAWPFILKKFPEVWRIFTSFMLAYSTGIILTPYLIWRFGGTLERDCVRLRSASFLVYLLFVGSVILVINSYIWMAPTFISPMELAILWTYAQNNRDSITSIMGINIPAKYLPAASLFMTLIVSGPEEMKLEATGIPAAHLWEFLTNYWPTYGGGINLVPTPGFLIRWFHGSEARDRTRVYRADTSELANSAFRVGNSWGQRGLGRRLGSD